MKKINNLIRVLLQLVCFAGVILLLIFILNGLTHSQPGANVQLPGYQPPQTVTPGNPQTAYPMSGIATPLGPAAATQRAFYLHTPSAAEITAAATLMAEENRIIQHLTPPPAITPFTFQVKSVADLPQVVYHDPFFGDVNAQDSGACVQAASPGSPILVHSLDQNPDYYILPFYKGATICGLAEVDLKGNLGLVGAWSNYHFGDKYPPVSSEEAVNQVTQKTHLNVIGTPLLVFRPFQEDVNEFAPLWKVTTSNGEIYYVLGIRAMMESGEVTTTISVMNAKDMHPIN